MADATSREGVTFGEEERENEIAEGFTGGSDWIGNTKIWSKYGKNAKTQ